MTRRLNALSVGNFKAFADTQRIPLKPITLIFGPNSAGKSSFIHSLALAHEAQFGREKRSLSRLDVHHTDVGGSSIDLGGFRQYVHRGQLNKRVEWGAELKVSALVGSKDQRLAQLLASVGKVSLNIAMGIELDDQDRPKSGAAPRVDAIEIAGDGTELLRMSRRRADGQGSSLRLDRLASDHPVFRQVLKAIVESATTSEEMRPEDFEGANEAIAGLLPDLLIRVDQFFPAAVDLPKAEGADLSPVSMLFPVSKGNRKEDIAQAVRFYLPRTLNDLIKGLADTLASELKQFQYLGPLRSFPPRHLAFAAQEDANWYAGGGYAWDVVRRNPIVRAAVNEWLGSERLKTPYKLEVKKYYSLSDFSSWLELAIAGRYAALYTALVNKDPDYEPLEPAIKEAFDFGQRFLEATNNEELDEANDKEVQTRKILVDSASFQDPQQEAEFLLRLTEIGLNSQEGGTLALEELVLIDKNRNTTVTHRDVGIGISQVLPVLVAAFGSEGRLIAMEQPEIHLHPALQAELGDVFIEAAIGRRKNTFILETHSEHLILRLMRRIREGKITPDDVGVVYVEPLARGSRFVELRIDDDGDFIDEWPGGFFEESFHEKFAGR